MRIAPGAPLRIRHLLVVAGAAGAGKTTFLDLLRAGKLPAELASELPPGASDWPQSSGSRIRGRTRARRDAAGRQVVEGIALHYDIMRVWDTLVEDYSRDPALLALSLADVVTVVTIRPSDERLARQIGQKPPDPGPIRSALKALERRLRGALRPGQVPVYREAGSEARHAKLRALYGQPGFLDERYAAWERFVIGRFGGRPLSFISVEPVGAENGRPSFRVRANGGQVRQGAEPFSGRSNTKLSKAVGRRVITGTGGRPVGNSILVVAGPGGAGKTTFIALLRSGALPGEIRDLLPDGVEGWPAHMPGVFRNPHGSGPPADSYVLHYDTTGPARKWGLDYAADQALAGLVTVQNVTVVDVRPTTETLIGQLEGRSAEANRRRGWAGRMWNRSLLRSLLQPSKMLRRSGRFQKPALYRQSGWLEQVYASWDAYLANLQTRTKLLLIRVEPAGWGDSPSFRIVECRSSGTGL